MEGITPVVYTYHEDYSCPVQLDLYTPKGYSPSTTSYKTAIVYHGGGLAVGNRSLYIPQAVMTLLHQQDWIVISADYHLLPESTTANIYSDVEALEQWLLAHHHELGVNLDRITTIGASAGSFVSSLLCVSWKTIRPKAFVNLFGMVNTASPEYSSRKDWGTDYSILGLIPVSSLKAEKFEKFLVSGRRRIWHDQQDMEDAEDRKHLFWWLMKEGKSHALFDGTLTNPSAVPQLVNPITLVTPDFPPTISIHGEKDSICSVEASRLFTQELKKLGVETTLVIIPGAEHGLYPEVDFMQYFEEAAEFLERYA